MTNQALLNNLEQYYELFAAKLRRLPVSFWRTLLIAGALVWLCQSLAHLVWVVLPAPSSPLPPVIAVQSIGEGADGANYSVDLTTLQSLQVFGDSAGEEIEAQAEAQVQPVQDIGMDAAKTSLKLDLVGVIASGDPDLDSAVIAQGSKQEIYQIDDKLSVGNNVTLAKVFSDRVILNNNGNYESLWLYSEADFKITYARNNQASEPEPQRENRIETKIRPAEMPKSISDVVRFSVHREDGQMVGFRIRPGKNRELFEQLGLQANDVVTSVNGIPIDTAEAIRDNYQELKKATAADLEVRRGEETVYINVSLDTTSE